MESLDIINRIKSYYTKMSRGQKLIADFILNNYDKAAFMTASKLGSAVGISESTVVRFAYVLEYDGYPQLQKALQELIRNKLTIVQRLDLNAKVDKSEVLSEVLKADMANIKLTIDQADNEIFESITDDILIANKIYIMGLRSAAPLAQFMGYYLNFILDNVKIVTSGVNDIFEQLIHIGKDDIIIGISFPRYATRAVEAMKFAKERGAHTIALTDTELSPLNAYADKTLFARSDMASFVDSLVAPLSLINATIVAVGNQKRLDISDDLHKLENMWSKYNVYAEKGRPEQP